MKIEYFVFGLIIIVSFYLSMIFHELAHIVTCKSLGCKLTKWKVGFIMFDQKIKFKLQGSNYINFLSNTKEKALLILLSGPVFSFILSISMLIVSLSVDNLFQIIYFSVVGAYNLLVFIFSLLPCRNNDGKRITPLIKFLKVNYQVGNLNNGMIIFLGLSKAIILSVLLFTYLCLVSGSFVNKTIWSISIAYLLLNLIYVIYLGIKDASLLEKRIINIEKNKFQRKLVMVGGIIILIFLTLNGLTYRFDLLMLGIYRYLISLILLILGSIIYLNVIKVNKYASSSINEEVNHEIVNKGIYSLIRHPLYLGSTLLFLSLGFALGSVYGLISLVLLIPIVILRIKNEEKVLINSSKEYSEYMEKVKYKFIPFIY